MRIDVKDETKVFLNGKPLDDCLWFDTEAGEACVTERHWSTGELVREPNGDFRTLVLKGKVTVEAPLALPPPESRHCYSCGGDCPPDFCQICCSGSYTSDPHTYTSDGPLVQVVSQVVSMESGMLTLDEDALKGTLMVTPASGRDEANTVTGMVERLNRQILESLLTRSCTLCGHDPGDDIWTIWDEVRLCSVCVLQMADNVRELLARHRKERRMSVLIRYDPCGVCDPRCGCQGHPMTEGN